MSDTIDNSKCPLCGDHNACQNIVADPHSEVCWCQAVHFDKALLERIADAEKNRACVCQQCALAARKKSYPA